MTHTDQNYERLRNMTKCKGCGKPIVQSEDWGDYDDACEWACEGGCENVS